MTRTKIFTASVLSIVLLSGCSVQFGGNDSAPSESPTNSTTLSREDEIAAFDSAWHAQSISDQNTSCQMYNSDLDFFYSVYRDMAVKYGMTVFTESELISVMSQNCSTY